LEESQLTREDRLKRMKAEAEMSVEELADMQLRRQLGFPQTELEAKKQQIAQSQAAIEDMRADNARQDFESMFRVMRDVSLAQESRERAESADLAQEVMRGRVERGEFEDISKELRQRVAAQPFKSMGDMIASMIDVTDPTLAESRTTVDAMFELGLPKQLGLEQDTPAIRDFYAGVLQQQSELAARQLDVRQTQTDAMSAWRDIQVEAARHALGGAVTEREELENELLKTQYDALVETTIPYLQMRSGLPGISKEERKKLETQLEQEQKRARDLADIMTGVKKRRKPGTKPAPAAEGAPTAGEVRVDNNGNRFRFKGNPEGTDWRDPRYWEPE
jgi:hypothetical protein